MNDTGDEKTAAMKACESCGGGMLDCDNFCRWCGTSQGAVTKRNMPAESSAIVPREPARYLTTGLEQLRSSDGLHRVSGPLVSAVVATLATGPASRPRASLLARAITGLLSFPLWLIIVLLSPLDAYAAAKNLSRGL